MTSIAGLVGPALERIGDAENESISRSEPPTGSFKAPGVANGYFARMTLLGFERRWLRVVFETVLGGADDRLPVAPSAVPLDRFIDELVESAPLHFVLGLKACLWAVMLAPPFVLGRWRTFLGLAMGERLALLERLGRSSNYVIREMPLLFKTIACLGFCGLPEVQSGIGIAPVDTTPPSWARRGLPMVGS
jgi:hypothetical protein